MVGMIADPSNIRTIEGVAEASQNTTERVNLKSWSSATSQADCGSRVTVDRWHFNIDSESQQQIASRRVFNHSA
jgi:hypothetical protein